MIAIACSAYDSDLLEPEAATQARGAVGSTGQPGVGSALDSGTVDGVLGDAGSSRDGSVSALGDAGAVSVPSAPDGEACSRDEQCASGHCDGERCCSEGVCCNSDDDCPGATGGGRACEDAASCQGKRGAFECSDHRCISENGQADDSACGQDVRADECGLYRDVFCNGEAEQEAPTCPESCSDDTECDPEAHCSEGSCAADAADGSDCESDPQCSSQHCENGVCCAGENCCRSASDCPSSYRAAATCGDAGNCQGSRTDALCVDSICGSEIVADDSACDGFALARECGAYPDVFCSGQTDQEPPPVCRQGNCNDDSHCNDTAHCRDAQCIPDQANGEACQRGVECASGYCENGYCCNEGECCATDRDCNDRYVCTNVSECRGVVYDRQCNDAFQCEETSEASDSSYGCVGQRVRSCSDPYRDVTCPLLSVPYVRRCDRCDVDSDCVRGYECLGNMCVTEILD